MVKTLKDENAPKRPLTAYFDWQNSVRDKVTASLPEGYKFGEVAAKFSELWKAMSDADKAPFEAKAKKASEKYKAAMAKYKLTDNYKKFQQLKEDNKFAAVKKQKFKKDENAPSRPQSAYFLFMADERDELVSGGMAHKDAVKKLGEMWSAMSADQKKPYDDKAAAAKAKYEKNVEKYKTTKAYKTYMAEKAEFEANKKAEIKRLKAADKEETKSSSTKKSSTKKSSSKKKSRSRSRSKKVKRSKSRSKSKSKKRSRSKSKKRSRSKSKSRKRSRSKSKSKKRSRSRSKSKKRSKSRSRSKAKKRSKSRSRSRSKKKN